MSKAALNMYGLKLSRELGPDGFTCVLFHPGAPSRSCPA